MCYPPLPSLGRYSPRPRLTPPHPRTMSIVATLFGPRPPYGPARCLNTTALYCTSLRDVSACHLWSKVKGAREARVDGIGIGMIGVADFISGRGAISRGRAWGVNPIWRESDLPRRMEFSCGIFSGKMMLWADKHICQYGRQDGEIIISWNNEQNVVIDVFIILIIMWLKIAWKKHIYSALMKRIFKWLPKESSIICQPSHFLTKLLSFFPLIPVSRWSILISCLFIFFVFFFSLHEIERSDATGVEAL